MLKTSHAPAPPSSLKLLNLQRTSIDAYPPFPTLISLSSNSYIVLLHCKLLTALKSIFDENANTISWAFLESFNESLHVLS